MKLKVAIIGFGYWNHYARIVNEHPDCELSMICDLKQENLDKAKEQFPNVITTTNHEDALMDKTISAVIICTPVKTHYGIAWASLFSFKHVLCEKAFTYTESEAKDLILKAKINNVKLSVGHTFSYNSCVKYIKKLLEEKALGDVYYVAMTRVGNSPKRQDVNALWDLGSHDISMLINWFGMPKEVSSFGESYLQDGLEDFCVTNLKFENRVIANIKNSWINPIKRRFVTIVGSEKMLVYDDLSKTVTLYFNDGAVDIWNADQSAEPLKEQVNDFISSIINNHEPLVSGTDGLNVVRVLESCQKSLKNNSEKITL